MFTEHNPHASSCAWACPGWPRCLLNTIRMLPLVPGHVLGVQGVYLTQLPCFLLYLGKQETMLYIQKLVLNHKTLQTFLKLSAIKNFIWIVVQIAM